MLRCERAGRAFSACYGGRRRCCCSCCRHGPSTATIVVVVENLPVVSVAIRPVDVAKRVTNDNTYSSSSLSLSLCLRRLVLLIRSVRRCRFFPPRSLSKQQATSELCSSLLASLAHSSDFAHTHTHKRDSRA